MKERPIIMQPESVRGILAGLKTQTRRVLKYTRQLGDPTGLSMSEARLHMYGAPSACPYGLMGDRLWVKERWIDCGDGRFDYMADTEDGPGTFRSSLFMPRRASRLMLLITDVCLQRLRNISELDAENELGLKPYSCGDASVAMFAGLWDQINGKRAPWASNPWVWVIEFRRV